MAKYTFSQLRSRIYARLRSFAGTGLRAGTLLGPALPRSARDARRQSRRQARLHYWTDIGIVLVFCILLTSCSFSLWGTKGTSEPKKAGQPDKDLLKPKIAADSRPGPSVRVRAAGTEDTDEDEDPDGSKSDKKQEQSPRPEETGNETQKEPADDPSERKDEPFKKHDHAEYKKAIKNSAIDTLNKHPDATAARICRDTMTDLWTLAIYSRNRGRLSFVIYFWDEVDGNWERSFESGNVPLKKWNNHLQYSSAGKSCTVLKGARLFGTEDRR
ncbi:MAG: hypothetical protein RDU20_08105 [Desulfomonilaceae bacterium]|nr:hypothetical protein [Desulfomonilaceae bacterium]